ncbi:MAG: hypothetical protein JW797_13150 [Bradymonadales bacterium]|nr:hypothetical protein [Bradymonadales bacterium]
MRKLCCLAILLACWLVVPASEASVVVRYSLDQMVWQADGIVHGRVLSLQSLREGTIIATYVEIEVIESYKGAHSPGDRLVVYRHGGTADGYTMLVAGEPLFVPGEEVLLFLENRPAASEPLVLGMAQGKFSVVVDPTTRGRMVTRNMTGVELIEVDEELMWRFADPAERSDRPESLPTDAEADPLLIQPLWIPLEQMTEAIERILADQGVR